MTDLNPIYYNGRMVCEIIDNRENEKAVHMRVVLKQSDEDVFKNIEKYIDIFVKENNWDIDDTEKSLIFSNIFLFIKYDDICFDPSVNVNLMIKKGV
jgi:hypothetical protein